RATDVGADLRVGDDAVVVPVFTARGDVVDEVLGLEPHEQHGGLGLLFDLVLGLGEVERYDVENRANGDVGGVDRGSGAVTGKACALPPHRVGDRFDRVGRRREVAKHDDPGEGRNGDCSDEGVAQQCA